MQPNPAVATPPEHVRELFELTGGRWTLSVLASLRGGRRRFGELQRDLPGVSQKQLTHTLRKLERDGYVDRVAYNSIPPRVDYELTRLGDDLVSRLTVIGRFVVDNRTRIEDARQRFEAAAAERRPW